MAIIDTLQRRVGFVLPSRFSLNGFALVCAVWLSGFHSAVLAHDPGLSYAKIVVEPSRINVHLSVARRDAEWLQPIDLNGDDRISDDEFANVELTLRKLVLSWVSLAAVDKAVTGIVTAVEYDTSDALHFSLAFPSSSAGVTHYRAALISRLPLGHRQFVGVYESGALTQNEMLSALHNDIELHNRPVSLWRQAVDYLVQGVWHIWIGYDHILFLLAMLLPAVLVIENGRWFPRRAFKSTLLEVVKIVSAFTLAHSITLSLAVLDLVRLNIALVETVIAASVVVAALNNIRPFVADRVWLMAFGFGLIHGFGFASVLSSLGLPTMSKGVALVGFNVGVELGQLVIIALALPLMFALRKQALYRPVILGAGSVAIAVAASVWLAERIPEVNFTSILSLQV